MKKLFYFAAAILAFMACSDDKNEPTPNPFQKISFETTEGMSGIDGQPVALGMISVVSGKNTVKFDHIYWAKEYTVTNDLHDNYDQLYFAAPFFTTADGKTWFSSYYCDGMLWGAQFDNWAGFILSSNVNKSVAASQAGLDNQFEAYADAGADGSSIFAVCYDALSAGMSMSADYSQPQIDFKGKARMVQSISLANSTWTYNYFMGDPNDSYAVKITGLMENVETGSVVCPLVEGVVKVSDWKKFDLTSLGEVDCLVFKVESSAPYAPFYFCVDNIVLKNN